MSGTLSIVATPIGNLKDITHRAVETLMVADLILAEDTRITSKLLSHYNIRTKVASLHEHSTDKELQKYIEVLQEGKHIALVTDAGTPGVSDPGGKFVDLVRTTGITCKIEPIPGASAVTALMSVSGVHAPNGTLFLGFPPTKKGRQTFLKTIVAEQDKFVIIFESGHRIVKFIDELNNVYPNCNLIIGRELTKMFEEVIKTNPAEYAAYLQKSLHHIKGEFVIGISKN